MKKLLDVAHGKLINIIGRHGNLDQYSRMSVIPLNDHLCSKSVQKTIAIVRDCMSTNKVASILRTSIIAPLVHISTGSKF